MATVEAPAKKLSHRERAVVVRLLASLRDDPEVRLRLQTKLFSITVAVIFGIIGGGFLFAGKESSAAPSTYQLLLNLVGSLRVHGAIMVGLSGLVTYTAREYKLASRIALALMGFYALVVALLILSGWAFTKVAFPAPMWYFLVAALCLILVRVAPTTPRDIHVARSTDRSERA